jgi:signal transduction histidine kinase
MFRNLKLSTKILVILIPLFFLAAGVSVFLNYRYQQEQILEQAKQAASVRATIIKESLVNMMVNNLKVDDSYIAQLNKLGAVQNLEIIFDLDSLHLREDLLTEQRLIRLRKRESKLLQQQKYAKGAMLSGEPLWVLHCELGKHEDQILETTLTWEPLLFSACENLQVRLPFLADAQCIHCHEVPRGSILGAAQFHISLQNTSEALRASVFRSIGVFLVFSLIAIGLGVVIFRTFVSKPINLLVDAANRMGSGDLTDSIAGMFDNDEFGKLAQSFDEMQKKLKTAQHELLQKERLSVVGQMASSIVHDFRSPMTIVLIGLETVRTNKNLSEGRRNEIYEQVKKAIQKMQQMTQELLDYTRGEITLTVQECDVQSFVEGIVKSVQESLARKRIHLSLVCDYHGVAKFDKERIERVLLNIINNAEDAMQEGGEITVRTYRDDSQLIFSISDTGGGIPEEIRDKIFEPFVTAGKKRGTGLGLAIVKKIVEQHGGEISFESQLSVGTTFTVKIPLQMD